MSETETVVENSKETMTPQTPELAGGQKSEETAEPAQGRNVDALLTVKLDVRVVLGHNRMPVGELLKLTRGSVIELDRKVGDPVDIMINDRLVARGDLIKTQGDMIGVAMREIVKDFAPAE